MALVSSKSVIGNLTRFMLLRFEKVHVATIYLALSSFEAKSEVEFGIGIRAITPLADDVSCTRRFRQLVTVREVVCAYLPS